VGPYLRRYGSGCLSSSTLWNPEFVHMFVPGMGSQVYVVGRAYNRTIVVGIGDPLAHRSHWPAMLRAFKQAFPIATFAHIGAEFAALVQAQERMPVTDMGAETNIMVQAWAYNKKTRTIRNAARDARALGYSVRELAPEDLSPEVCKQLAHVTGEGGGGGGWGAGVAAGPRGVEGAPGSAGAGLGRHVAGGGDEQWDGRAALPAAGSAAAAASSWRRR
jgi:hypothetical protein